jgi:ribosomal protein S18 acetylase RimI-like enzyme
MIRLRPASPEDQAFLFDVYAGTRQDELALVDWNDAQKDAFLRMQFEARERHYRDNYRRASFDVVLHGDVPVGLLYVARWPEEIRIIDVAVLPEQRGRGIGTAVLERVLAEGTASGRPVTIHVERFNPALRLYERLGFRQVEDKGVYLLLERCPPAGDQVKTAS